MPAMRIVGTINKRQPGTLFDVFYIKDNIDIMKCTYICILIYMTFPSVYNFIYSVDWSNKIILIPRRINALRGTNATYSAWAGTMLYCFPAAACIIVGANYTRVELINVKLFHLRNQQVDPESALKRPRSAAGWPCQLYNLIMNYI